jgi:hypothetical protein
MSSLSNENNLREGILLPPEKLDTEQYQSQHDELRKRFYFRLQKSSSTAPIDHPQNGVSFFFRLPSQQSPSLISGPSFTNHLPSLQNTTTYAPNHLINDTFRTNFTQ